MCNPVVTSQWQCTGTYIATAVGLSCKPLISWVQLGSLDVNVLYNLFIDNNASV